MTSLLAARMKHLEDLKNTVPRRPHGSLHLQRIAPTNTSLVARLEWCQRQGTQAPAEAELEGWHAEEAGLRDALLNRDRTYQYRCSPSGVLERYAMGLEDGRLLIRVARRDGIRQPAAMGTHL